MSGHQRRTRVLQPPDAPGSDRPGKRRACESHSRPKAITQPRRPDNTCARAAIEPSSGESSLRKQNLPSMICASTTPSPHRTQERTTNQITEPMPHTPGAKTSTIETDRCSSSEDSYEWNAPTEHVPVKPEKHRRIRSKQAQQLC